MVLIGQCFRTWEARRRTVGGEMGYLAVRETTAFVERGATASIGDVRIKVSHSRVYVSAQGFIFETDHEHSIKLSRR